MSRDSKEKLEALEASRAAIIAQSKHVDRAAQGLIALLDDFIERDQRRLGVDPSLLCAVARERHAAALIGVRTKAEANKPEALD